MASTKRHSYCVRNSPFIAMAGAMLILAGVLIGLYGLAVLLGDREPDGTVREGVAGAKRRRRSKR